MPMRWDPTLNSRERDPLADGGSARAAQKAQKREAKLRTHELIGEEGHGFVATNRQGEDDRTYADLGWFEYVVRIGRGEVPSSDKAELNAVDARGRGSVAHQEFTPTPPAHSRTFVAAAPFVARLGDPTVHGSPLGPGLGSSNVLVGGMPAFRAVIDTHVCPLVSPVPHGGGVVAVGAPTVLVNGFPIARAGDVIIEAAGGPNPILYGSLTVWAGPLAPPVELTEPTSTESSDDAIQFDDVQLRTDQLYAEAQVKAGVQGQEGAGGPSVRMKAEVQAALVRAEGQGGVRIRIPGFDQVLRIRGRGSVALACYGAEGEIEIGPGGDKKINTKGLGAKRGVCGDAEVNWDFEDDPRED
jgi:uncharacterized Zn-binding protein involved in type VI secretion